MKPDKRATAAYREARASEPHSPLVTHEHATKLNGGGYVTAALNDYVHSLECLVDDYLKLRQMPTVLTEEGDEYPLAVNVINGLQSNLRAWRELYYSLFGLTRNTIRTGASAQQRVDEIDQILADHLVRHRALDRGGDE
jgi:hypothetical protein